jgi:hypothetical protein
MRNGKRANVRHNDLGGIKLKKIISRNIGPVYSSRENKWRNKEINSNPNDLKA